MATDIKIACKKNNNAPVRSIGIALIGLGNVGYSTAKAIIDRQGISLEKVLVTSTDVDDQNFYLDRNFDPISDSKSQRPNNREKVLSLGVSDRLITTGSNPMKIFQDQILAKKEIDIVIDLTGDTNEALNYIESALKAGKHVITATKSVISEHGEFLSDLANKNHCLLKYEASVGAAIPMLTTLNTHFCNDRITGLMGILNGTTNFVLDLLSQSNTVSNVKDAIVKAIDKGFAEPNYEADINGTDVIHKLSILASTAFKTTITPEIIRRNGVVEGLSEKLSTLHTDVLCRHNEIQRGVSYKLKYLAIVELRLDELFFRIAPFYVPSQHPLSAMKNEQNGIVVTTEHTGDNFLAGLGAGPVATTQAILSDAENISKFIRSQVQFTPTYYGGNEYSVGDARHCLTRGCIISHSPLEPPHVFEAKAQPLRNNKISKAKMTDLFEEYPDDCYNPYLPYVINKSTPDLIVTLPATEAALQSALRGLEELKELDKSKILARSLGSAIDQSYIEPSAEITFIRILEGDG